jgi:RNA polymerase sigma-70 factor (ECF subfamily)
MPSDSRPVKLPVPHSSEGNPDAASGSDDPQLSVPARVQSDVSSVAIDPGLLAGAHAPGSRTETGRTGARAPFAVEALTDADVMLRVKAGDDSAFEYLIQKYRRAMVSFMFRMAHNSAVAEDLAQEVFLRVYRSRQNYEASAKFTTWLYRIATNLAVNHARDTRHERPENVVSLDEKDEDTGQSLDLPDRSLTVEERMVRRERMSAIRQRVQALPERQRVAVLMHKYQQMDYKQISEVLKLSESATKSLLFRAYETLREQLKEFL